MKTIQPKDWSKTPDQYLIESRMGVSEQKSYLRNSIAYLFVFGFAVWLAAWSINELYEIYTKAGQVEAVK